MTSTGQYPPSSPPVHSPAHRSLLPSFEPSAASRKDPSPVKRHSPSRKRARADTPRDDRGRTPSRQRIVPSDSDDISSRLPQLQTFYPTPAPTSSAALSVSSPSNATRAFIQDDELDDPFVDDDDDDDDPHQPIVRAPLSTVVLARVPRNGDALTLGRSSNSSSVVLSRTNKLISRVHVTARYIAVRNTIELRCLGWNGARVGTPTGEHALAKGESVEIPAYVNVIIDVCGERARVEVVIMEPDDDETDEELFVSEKEAREVTISESDASPCKQSESNIELKIWEDKEDYVHKAVDKKENTPTPRPSTTTSTTINEEAAIINTSDTITSDAREQSPAPITPVEERESTPTPVPNVEPREPETDLNKLKTHIIAHLAYSRLASTPLSVLHSSLPITSSLPDEILRSIINGIPCVGVIKRQGKDASGKRLEEQYYYIPEQDEDLHRRAAVEELRGHPGLRSCRKVHKQYFWRKPALK
ncbi:hypothetical protein POJ06DRAFT_3330 [Lipomyces tetrasporus]|uniref:FHA domain-containing protein n=1 Tax=Lipomyces tetrasporus TaxID=54092 RepID=A0AAD7QY27_9ASCO|nr:uncharacterized protein POJ06DRAFT_3330 [Lipomyces tetrasporus]KAJ8103550.1 hypothetical protein POJ06DRAFT_3330 [Lipomyces tetrasporus]